MNRKLTIITVNLNNRDGLRKTIESVVAQTTREFEFIVIDGGSTDGSVEVIKEYAKFIDYWVSESDSGIYNAMNKGVQKAHGRYCQFLNSGDWLYSNVVVECLLPYLDLDIDIFVGYVQYTKEDGTIGRLYVGSPKALTLHHLIRYPLSHQSCFIKTRLLLKIPYNETFRAISDWVFCIDAYFSDVKFAQVPFDVAYFCPGGISSTEITFDEYHQKRREFIHPYLLAEIERTPAEIINLFNQIPTAYRFKHLICAIDKFLVKIYSLFKKIEKNDKYIRLSPPTLSRKQKKAYRLLQ